MNVDVQFYKTYFRFTILFALHPRQLMKAIPVNPLVGSFVVVMAQTGIPSALYFSKNLKNMELNVCQ